MDDKKPATETDAQTIAPAETTPISVVDDAEARIAALEAEKAAILEREANYKQAYLKEVKKNESINPNETEEERIRRITREELAQRQLTALDTEKEELLKKLARENKELKLASMNRPTTTPAGGSSTEAIPVRDTTISADQMAFFKSKNWSDKDIEQYKKNLQRNTR